MMTDFNLEPEVDFLGSNVLKSLAAVIGKCVFKHIKSQPLLINYRSGMEQSVQATARC